MILKSLLIGKHTEKMIKITRLLEAILATEVSKRVTYKADTEYKLGLDML